MSGVGHHPVDAVLLRALTSAPLCAAPCPPPLPVIDYIKRLRYCEYLGRYFCQCCHENAQAVVPGRVLRKWDFSKYYVSNFARDLLSKIAGDPLFNPSDINNDLYKKIKALESVRVSRKRAEETAQQRRSHSQSCARLTDAASSGPNVCSPKE